MNLLRLVAAGLFVFASLTVAVVSFAPFTGASGLLLPLAIVLVGAAAVAGAMWIFSPRVRLATDSPEAVMRELQANGLLETASFVATRAFQVEEFEDEGSHYFIELADRTVLYLNGQYLYEYEPIDDDVELKQPRRFPCTSFVIRRHRLERYVVNITCDGDVLEPEVVAPSFSTADYNSGHVPEDGEIIIHAAYEKLKADRLATH